jgi:hypothetical protein
MEADKHRPRTAVETYMLRGFEVLLGVRELPSSARKPSLKRQITAAEKATGKPVTSVTLADGTKLDFGRAAPAEPTSNDPVTVTDFDEWLSKKRRRNADQS